jgi:anaerobic selenocysteine-containing dehydrogenase
MPDGQTQSEILQNSALKNVVCTSCDGFCPVAVKVDGGQAIKVTTRDHPLLKDVLCMKGAYAPKSFAHPSRLLKPLKRVGARGDGNWQEVSWDTAMDDIADRLKAVISKYGPEAFAVGQSGATGLSDSGLARRFMNHIGSPNWISGVAYCMGNTAAVNRLVYGWYPRTDILNSNCIVLFGHDPRRHSWTMEYKSIRMRQAKGAKLIVLDPRKSENAEVADVWLPLRAGTDAIMTFGWLNVIIEEGLYDKEFVRHWTVGFDEFVERANEYPLDRVADVTGVDAELIQKAARMYATSSPSTIPWSPITDQQVSSTSAIRLQCILRAITGNLDVKGGDTFVGFSPAVRSDTEIEMHHLLSEEQKLKQLGNKEFPVFTYRGMEALGDATEKVWGTRYANLVSGSYMANPMAVFKAMADGDPYPVKAFFAMANNALMAYANTDRVYKALMNQDLIVSFEHAMTPTAEISDYVLPGDSWLERPSMQAGISDQAMEAPGECKNVATFWHMLAARMGLAEAFPWKTQEELINYRLEPSGATWREVVKSGRTPNLHRGQAPDDNERKYLKTGFATPSGKVELYSETLKDLGFDPLPYYREAAETNEKYPLRMFIGLPDDEYFRTGMRHVPELRKRVPDQTFFMSPNDADKLSIVDGQWTRLTTKVGSVFGRVFVRSSMPDGLVRVPHGWWKPESKKGLDNMSGLWDFCDGRITTDDDPELLDLEQGIPHMKGVPCSVEKISNKELARLEKEYGPTNELRRGPEGKVLRSDAKPNDFMFDEFTGEGVEFEAVELSLYGRNTM